VDRLICVSEGVAEDTRRLAGLPAERTPVIRNPVVGPELPELAAQAPDHPWLAPGAPPVVLGIGRLTRQKDFATLLRAFARVRGEREVRLLILGDGGLRGELEALAPELGIARDVELPGFQKNPYAFLARAGVFVLSSIWEGSPNALAEALALGVPAVATDCPSGPREILQDGRVAPLVPMESPEALASAIIQMLEAPPPPEALQAAVAEYTVERSVARYLATLTASSDPV
jgi:glycosyltransferase involved in cell wall biosynthesis